MRARHLLLAVTLAPLAACGGEQTPACEAYVACAAHYDATFDIEPATDTSAYDEAGSCWRTQAISDACSDNCEQARISLADALVAAGEDLGPCAG